MRYRKDDVDIHAEYMQDGHAAVNVKDRSYDVPLADVLDDFGYILATGVDADELAEAIASDQYSSELCPGSMQFGNRIDWDSATCPVCGFAVPTPLEDRSSGTLGARVNRHLRVVLSAREEASR